MSRFEDIWERHSPRTAESSSEMPAPEASEGSVARAASPRRVKACEGYFADAKFPVVDRLTEGEEYCYLFERVSVMMRGKERDG